MKFACTLLIFTSLLILGITKKEIDEEAYYRRHKKIGIRIAGGTQAFIQDMPYMASLVERVSPSIYRLICTSVIIHRYWVISSFVECVEGRNETQLRNGHYFIRGNTAFYDGRTKQAKNHRIERWYWKRLFFDKNRKLKLYVYGASLSLIKVREPFRAAHERPIKLAFGNYKYVTGSRATQAGWGWTRKVNWPSAVLRKVDTKLADYNRCRKSYKFIGGDDVVTRDMQCAFSLRAAACIGDTGGPLIQHNLLIGVLSYSIECKADHLPNLYTKITHFRNWIDVIINSGNDGNHSEFGGLADYSYEECVNDDD